MNLGVVYAMLAAIFFGVSTPLAKLLGANISPVLLAGFLYAGSGLGLSLCMILRRVLYPNEMIAHLSRKDVPWLTGAVVMGGIIAPVLLMFGITFIHASSASLLLNLEGVFTALIAWFVFKENFDHRIFMGMLFIVAAGGLLSWQETQAVGIPLGGVFVVSACLFWGVDNSLTRKVSASDSLQIAAIKGCVAGAVNMSIAFIMGATLPDMPIVAESAMIGLFGYGISLVLFVLALRNLGAARTGAYFSVAPFVGAVVSILLLHEGPPPTFWIAGGLMVIGIWLHLTERHAHEHTHEELAHEHSHVHDEHHQHIHDFEWDGNEPHTHSHQHVRLTHSHQHYPDIHHQHKHS